MIPEVALANALLDQAMSDYHNFHSRECRSEVMRDSASALTRPNKKQIKRIVRKLRAEHRHKFGHEYIRKADAIRIERLAYWRDFYRRREARRDRERNRVRLLELKRLAKLAEDWIMGAEAPYPFRIAAMAIGWDDDTLAARLLRDKTGQNIALAKAA